MAFVFEKILAEERNRLRGIRVPFVGGDAETSHFVNYWVIDRERDAFLVFLGGGGPEMPSHYLMKWKGEKIDLRVKEESTGHPLNKEGMHVCQNVFPYAVPESLRLQEAEIL